VCDNFPIQNCLKRGDDLSPLLFNFSVEYGSRKATETQVGLKVSGTYQRVVYTDIGNVISDNLDTI
jgi:hypothetical protein